MKRTALHDFAKFFAGLILGDFIMWWWLASASLLPVTVWGITLNSGMVVPAMIFDAALFIILVHYGWHLGKTPTLRTRAYFIFVGVLLGIVALAHLVRLFTGADVIIAGWAVPLWLSWVGTIVTAYLSYMSFHLSVKA